MDCTIRTNFSSFTQEVSKRGPKMLFSPITHPPLKIGSFWQIPKTLGVDYRPLRAMINGAPRKWTFFLVQKRTQVPCEIWNGSPFSLKILLQIPKIIFYNISIIEQYILLTHHYIIHLLSHQYHLKPFRKYYPHNIISLDRSWRCFLKAVPNVRRKGIQET